MGPDGAGLHVCMLIGVRAPVKAGHQIAALVRPPSAAA